MMEAGWGRGGGKEMGGDGGTYIHCKTRVINTVTRPIKIDIIPSADNIFGKCIPIAGVDVEDIEK